MNRTLCILIQLLLVLTLAGQDRVTNPESIRSAFTVLDWNELRIDSVLPEYTEVVPLETDYRQYTYTVNLEYPEYAPLSKREAEVAHRFDYLIEEQIKVKSHVGVLRQAGMLDIAFIPIVRRDGHYLKLVSARVIITPVPLAEKRSRRVTSSKEERYSAHSVLATGRWVRISITEDGMYQLTRSALTKMGFKNPSKVHLYGYGGHRQNEVIRAGVDYDDLEEVPLFHSPSLDAWLFWGNGLLHWEGNTRVTNYYANAASYFLTENDEENGIETIPAPSATPIRTYTSFTDHVLYEKDEYAWYAGGRNLYENANLATGSRTYRLQTLSSIGDEKLTVSFSAAASSPTTLITNVNGTDMSAMSLAALSKYINATLSNNTYNIASLRNGESDTWNIRLSSTAGNNARLDYLALHYTRRITPSSGYVAFSQNTSGVARFQTNAPANHVIMRVGEPGSPAALVESSFTEDTGLAATVADASRTYVCFDPAYSFPQPTYEGPIENQDLHALDSLDMVILIPKSGKLLYQAERLAEAHRQFDNLRVAILRADQVYNEFSSGTPDATAYRRMMKMLYDRALQSNDVPPRYLLLMGDCAWDNRMLSSSWRNMSPDDYLLCYESENSVSNTRCYIMEDYFGLMDDGEGGALLKDKSDLGIGRFPVTTEAEAKVMVDKSINFMSLANAESWKNIVCMLGDDGDENEHMRFADDVAKRIASDNPEMEIRKVMWDAYKRVSSISNNGYPEVVSFIKKQQEEGALVINYTGHGNAVSLSHEFVLSLNDFQNFQGTHLPLWVTAACDIMPFDGSTENIGEAAVLNPSGGALAFYGTTRTVYANQNLQMNRYFMRYLFACDANGERYRLGDAICLAKNAIIAGGGESGLEENKLHYALLGDPALTLGAPLQRVVLDSINGKAIQKESIALRAGQHVKLSGHVGSDSNVLSDFQGVLTMRLFDSERTVTCLNNAGANTVFEYLDRGSALCTARDSVNSGHFSIDFVIPVDINYSDASGRIVFYAISTDSRTEANGYCEQFTLGGISDELATDTEGPRIYAFLNDEDFENGDQVNSEPFFMAALEDESGVSASGNGVGHDLSLCIDGRADLIFNLNDYYQSDFGDFTRGMVFFSLPALEPGPHTLTFRAWDVLNNTSVATLDFVVNPSLKPHMLKLTASPNPITAGTTFLILHDRPGATCTFTVEVFDFAGRCLWKHTETGSSASGLYGIPWNLSTQGGSRLGSGIYLCRCLMQCGSSKQVSKTQKIIILNNK